MQYISTRGAAPKLNFREAALEGLARDGGLYVPESWPALPDVTGCDYIETARRVLRAFTGEDFLPLLKKAYTFDLPLRQLDDNLYLLELFHGPTLAFKDVALQFLGLLIDDILQKKNERVTIVGATSGDTGSAAIEAFKNSRHADIFILHPKGRVSEVQRRQMTTVDSPNVHNIAVEGSFDDCQNIVKAMFNDTKFRDEVKLSAVNSINWARILAQVVYYVYAGAQLKKPVSFCVPTGNFGNVYAGYVARSCGLPVEKLIVASNRNDILYRFFQTGEMKPATVEPSLSPSMDIQISSNFERVLFDMLNRDGDAVASTMKHGTFRLDLAPFSHIFAAGRADDKQTLETIAAVRKKYGVLVDPHTAVGLHVAASHKTGPVVALATAHPAKFPEAVKKATGETPALPAALADLYERKERYTTLSADLAAIKAHVLTSRHG